MTSVENPCWVGCQTYIYSMPLWAQHLVVDYPAAEQFVHPYRVLLAVIQIVYPQPLEVEVGEFLVRPVVLRAYVTVEVRL